MSYDLIFKTKKKLSEAEVRLTSSAIKDYATRIGGEFLLNREVLIKNVSRLGTLVCLDDPWQPGNTEIFENMFNLLRSFELELYDPQLSKSIETG